MASPEQQTMSGEEPTFSFGTTFVFNGKKYYHKPMTKGDRMKAACCPLLCPVEDKFHETHDEYLSYRVSGCWCWPCCETLRWTVKHDKKDVGVLRPAGVCENGCCYAIGCKCCGEVILAHIDVEGKPKYTVRQFLECCGCLWACLEKPCFRRCCCPPKWHVNEMPIYPPKGEPAEAVGFIKTITHHVDIQDIKVCVDGASIEEQAALTVIPWLSLDAKEKNMPGSFIEPGVMMNTVRNLHINRVDCSFDQMLTLAHKGHHASEVKGAKVYK